MTTSYRLAADFCDSLEIIRSSSQPKLHVTMPRPALRVVCVCMCFGEEVHTFLPPCVIGGYLTW